MERIRIVTDSVACLPPEIVARYGIHVAPVRITVDGREYKDTEEDLPPSEVVRLQQARSIDTTPWPPEHYATLYRSVGAAADRIVHVIAFSQFTSTISLARAGAAMAREALPGLNIEVVDSASTGMAQGFIARAAAQAAQAAAGGGAGGDVLEAAAAMRGQVKTLYALDSLSYVARTGRVDRLMSWAAAMLRVVPIVGLAQGKERPVALARSRTQALRRLVQLMREDAPDGATLHIAVTESGCRADAERFVQLATEQLRPAECLITTASPVTQVIAGPGMLSVAWYPSAPDS